MARVKFKDEEWDRTVSYLDTPAVRDKVFRAVLAFFKEHGSYSGECIGQSDNPQIYAPCLLGTIADDIMKFKVTYENDET